MKVFRVDFQNYLVRFFKVDPSVFVMIFSFVFLFFSQAFASPASLTYQGRILKSDGSGLEYNNVSFIFQITDPTGQCVIYQEQVSGLNMTNSGGVFDIPIGLGTIQYPLSGTTTVLDAFNNSSSFACGSCSSTNGTYSCTNGSGTYTASLGDVRKLHVSFYDGTGWKLITPDNIIRTVPFAAYSLSAQKLGTYNANDFLLKAGLPNCGAGTFLTWNGTALTCAAVSGASGGTVTEVTSTNSYLSVATGTSAPALTVNVGTSAGTVAAGNDSRIIGAIQSGAAAGGSLTGTFPNPGIANNAVTTSTISDGAVTTAKALTTNPGINRIVGTDGVTGAALSKMECSVDGHVLSWTVATGFQCNAISSLYTAPITSVAGKTGAVTLGSADIGDATSANTANMLVKRDASGNFAAGTITGAGLVTGTLQVTGGVPASGKVLTSDASGNATWQALTASQWATIGSDIYYNTGNVGIGTTAPDSSAALTTSTGALWSLSLANSGAGGSGWYIGSSNNSWSAGGGKFLISKSSTSSASAFAIDGSGNVGIGTTAPGDFLEIDGNSESGTPHGITLKTASSAPAWYGPQIVGQSSKGTLSARTASGNGDILVQLTGQSFASSQYSNSGSIKIGSDGGASFASYPGFVSFSTAGTSGGLFERMRIDKNGNVGIGTANPTQKLHMSGSGDTALLIESTGAAYPQIVFANSNGSFNIGEDQSGSSLYFYNGSSGRFMNMTSSGNVGIGTTSPRAGLDVNSTILTKAATSNAGSTIDFSTGNLQYTSSSCGAFQFNNMKDGGNYMFAVKGTTSATCSFTAFSDAGVTALTVHLPPDHGASIAGKQTLYTLVVIGADVYISWTPGY